MRLVTFLLAWLLLTATAHAACGGKDLLPGLRTMDPAGVQAVFQRSHAVVNGQGRFWRIERAGTPPSYLLGTFHTAEALQTMTPAMWRAFDATDAALFEMNLDEQARLEERMVTDPNFSFDTTLPPLLDQLTEAQRQVLKAAFVERGLPAEAANQMRPWLLAGLLGFPACHIRAAQQGAEPMDAVLAERARDAGRPTYSLETYEEALSSFGVLDRDSLISALIADPEIAAMEEDIFQTHSQLYADGETVAINETAIWLAQRSGVNFDVRALNTRLMDSLLGGRNRNWMPHLLPHLQTGGTFVAVGALHLAGEDGLIQLIRAQGYTVTRLD